MPIRALHEPQRGHDPGRAGGHSARPKDGRLERLHARVLSAISREEVSRNRRAHEVSARPAGDDHAEGGAHAVASQHVARDGGHDGEEGAVARAVQQHKRNERAEVRRLGPESQQRQSGEAEGEEERIQRPRQAVGEDTSADTAEGAAEVEQGDKQRTRRRGHARALSVEREEEGRDEEWERGNSAGREEEDEFPRLEQRPCRQRGHRPSSGFVEDLPVNEHLALRALSLPHKPRGGGAACRHQKPEQTERPLDAQVPYSSLHGETEHCAANPPARVDQPNRRTPFPGKVLRRHDRHDHERETDADAHHNAGRDEEAADVVRRKAREYLREGEERRADQGHGAGADGAEQTRIHDAEQGETGHGQRAYEGECGGGGEMSVHERGLDHAPTPTVSQASNPPSGGGSSSTRTTSSVEVGASATVESGAEGREGKGATEEATPTDSGSATGVGGGFERSASSTTSISTARWTRLGSEEDSASSAVARSIVFFLPAWVGCVLRESVYDRRSGALVPVRSPF
ncbi:hypothetical protein A1Q1_03248 [Trichosporon asahii var. asahii CBS 2479]|uniref:Uncharacterized protein n=1 Tax=Trichosporon asahii var. asahii (strain ATCC 90039 / CBS 2479 / JCM 2466 / KCTC 7840 / NBRC 103889/ NCYC 2677 / UAMH 7654) TaxID=1186058 RepID=J5SW98_TRIAS|nr:hypothetical protein A1Q1_03248 [Trichosporon asahii var. asahii CBS 2479]EJT47871.1 hypothetical protein A1Q1_03248 [Trichosporon asahii var. asahii CBS 2479]